MVRLAALTANCLSCAAGVSQKEYCQDFPNTLGCQNKLGQGKNGKEFSCYFLEL